MASAWRIAVAGGSLGGLSAALVLRDLGADVTVYERSPAELEQRGAGIGFLPASSRYLVERAGLDLDRISTRTERIRYLARDGDIVHDEAHTYRFSSWNTVYRQLLQCFGAIGRNRADGKLGPQCNETFAKLLPKVSLVLRNQRLKLISVLINRPLCAKPDE